VSELAGYFVGALLGALVLPVIWILLSFAIPPLQRRRALVYGVAITLAVLSALVGASASPAPIVFLLAGISVSAFLFWQYKRASKSVPANVDRGA
jgi:hypothetical protein